ncbi:glycoside hydrolase family 76 protein [Cyanobacteria bacterium FACHB-DQ100]|nr:glycoside hydrolase family 76 protein [Cyanobacteria bacterium FACHB-DQ100]
MAALQLFYSSSTGLWKSTGWWNAANALETTIDYSRTTNQSTYRHIISNTYNKQKSTGFTEADVYDDQGWWALTWIKAYDLTGEKRYLNTAKAIFRDMTKGWDSKCGGGMWWRKDRQYKNAITNELFFTIAIRLHQRTVNDYGKGSYLDWSKRGWNWIKRSGMINRQNLINDGLDDRCRNNGQTTWTYNQGVVIGGLVGLYKSTKDRSYLNQAHTIANATIQHLSRNGVLREPCEPNCGEDGPQFKGIFIRNLAYLHQTSPNSRYRDFMVKNASSVWAKSRNDRHQFGLSWAKGFDRADAARQSAALDVLNASIPFDSTCIAKVSDSSATGARDRPATIPLFFSSVPLQQNQVKQFDLSFNTQDNQVAPSTHLLSLIPSHQNQVPHFEPSFQIEPLMQGLISFLALERSLQ